MGEQTTIPWCHHTFNGWIGCAKVSAGCKFCYAEADMDLRRHMAKWGPDGTRHVTSDDNWRKPLKWDRDARAAGERRRVFAFSLADVFEDRPELVAPRVRLFHLIGETPNLDWLLLTKRPENIRRFCGAPDTPRSWSEAMPPNVWLGASVEDQAAAGARVLPLLRTRPAVPFLSVEPMLGPVDLGPYLCDFELGHGSPNRNLRWVICGAESGPNRRPFDLDWARSLRDQCKAAGVAFFMKQDSHLRSDQRGRIEDALWLREFPASAAPAPRRPTQSSLFGAPDAHPQG